MEGILVISFGVIVLAAFLMLRQQRKFTQEKEELRLRYEDEREQINKEHSIEVSNLKDNLSFEREQKIIIQSELNAKIEALLERDKMEKNFEEKQAEYISQLKDSFKALTAENSDYFKSKSAETISEIMKPVQEKFQEFSQVVKESQEKSLERQSKLEQKISDLDARSQKVGEDAKNLADAILGHSKAQGDFGEMLLVDLLNNAGLTEGYHYKTQSVMTDDKGYEIKSDSGRTMIPDVMVFYPDNTIVIVDSKVSLSAYVKYNQAEDIESRKKYAKEHVESIKRHIDELKTKDYASYLSPSQKKVEYNIMFVPMEGAFRLMLEEDPLLWQTAKDNNVLIVSQMTLMIVLNMINMSWKQYEQEKNIEAVYKVTEELMSQLKSWLEKYVKVGEALKQANQAYEDSNKKLTTSQQSVIKKIQKLEDLGLTPKRSTGKIKTGERSDGPSSIIPKILNVDEEILIEE